MIFVLLFLLGMPVAQADSMQSYLERMPKAELHLHLEGSVDAETVVKISHRNDLSWFSSVEEIQQSLADRPPGLMGFLEHHFKLQNVLQTRQDFYDATFTLAGRLADNGIVYADIFFDPQAHTSRGIAFADLFEGIDQARVDAAEKFGIRINLIMCINRERSLESALAMLEQAEPYRQRILGLGMDSGPEYGNPPLKFAAAYTLARERGYYLTGHHDVDVRDSVKHLWQSVDTLKLDRIDHGLNAVDDPELVSRLVADGLCLTGSPVKRSTDPAMQDVDRITALDKAGVCVSIHTDDPEEFESGYLNNMMVMFQQASDYSRAEMTRLSLNAFRALWVPEAEKQAYIAALRAYAESNGVSWSEVTSGVPGAYSTDPSLGVVRND